MSERSTITVGLDVHKATIAVCALKGASMTGEEQEIPNEPGIIRRFFKKLKREGDLRCCYEAGPTGYELRRQLEKMGIACEVIAPSLIPRSSGDRVKTDRRDARKLARLYRAGELTPIRIPTEKEEAVRDLLRAREDIGEDLIRERHRLLKFVLRHGRIWRETKNWSAAHWQWLRTQRFDEPPAQRTFEEYLGRLDYTIERRQALDREIQELAKQEPWCEPVARLRCLRGVDTLAALTLVAEIQDFRRFASPRELMSYVGLTPTIHASGERSFRGSITKNGNAHVRRILVEAAWHYRHRPNHGGAIGQRMKDQPASVVEHAKKAQRRLHEKYRNLAAKDRPRQVVVTAVARELVGFVWAILVKHDAKPAPELAPKLASLGAAPVRHYKIKLHRESAGVEA
jgi:transposase